MAIARREFLRAGLALAAAAAAESGCSSLQVHAPPPPSGGWDQVEEILAGIVQPEFRAADYDVTNYGAAGDGKTDCHPAFAAAIAACSQAGGGRVVVPAARRPYLCNGSIHLLSNVNFYVEQGAEIVFGTNPADYLPVVLVRYQGIRCYNYSPLIYAYKQTNIAVTGGGVFNGQALQWASWETLANPDWITLQGMVASGVPVDQRIFGSGHHLRLTMFEAYECNNILIEGVTFSSSPFWTMHPVFCRNITIRDVTVLPGTSNDDGCDPDSCSGVLIDGCTFSTADDNISIKAGFGTDAAGLPECENIVIQNCTAIATVWGGYTIGSNTAGNVRNVFIQNCITQKSKNAFFIKSNRQNGGTVENVFIRSSKAIECQQFLYLETNYGGVSSGPAPPLFSNVVLQSMSCDQASGTAFALDGDEANPIQYVALTDIAIGSAQNAQQVTNTLFVASTNVTIGGQQVNIQGTL
jgi:polygalacturonase